MKKLTILLLSMVCLHVMADHQPTCIDLSGTWQFALDRQQVIRPNDSLTETVELPGTTDTNKKGDPIVKKDETTHLSRLFSYKGRAWYKRQVEIPSSWKGRAVYLFLERTKPTEIYVDAQFVDSSNDISTPQVFNLSKYLTPGQHTLAIMVDNGSGVPEQLYASSHAYTEDTQTNWNGIIGRIELFTVHSLQFTDDYSANGMWHTDISTVNPIFKDFHIKGQHFYANGHKIFLRGKHDACVWPLTGHVAMDVDSWMSYLGDCAAYGLNHVRFHSWCPPEAAFVAADELGIVLQPELPFWGDFNDKDTVLMNFLHKEGVNILRTYGHHPSFRMFALGNELWGSIDKMAEFIEDFRKIAPDKVYTFGSNYYLGYQGVKKGMDYFTTCRVGGEAWGDFNDKDTVLMNFLHKEGENILRTYGHHPSFRMFALGNELWGSIDKMAEFIEDFRKIAPDKVYTFGSNYYLGYQGVKKGMDYFTTCRVGGEAWGKYNTHTRGSFSFADAADGGMLNHFHPNSTMNFEEGCNLANVPIISHETAQFQTYPDYDEIAK